MRHSFDELSRDKVLNKRVIIKSDIRLMNRSYDDLRTRPAESLETGLFDENRDGSSSIRFYR